MKRKISIMLLAGLLPTLSVQAISNVNVENGNIDRVFDEERTLYYVTPQSDTIPVVTADGAEMVRKASDMSGDNIESLTLFKDSTTGVLYRFVMESGFRNFSVDKFNFEAETHNITAEGTNNTGKDTNMLVLLPYSEEESIYDLEKCSMSDIEDKIIYMFSYSETNFSIDYTFPDDAECGDYIVMIGNNTENIVQKNIYYATEQDVLEGLKEFNNMSYSTEKQKDFETLVEKNEKLLNLETDNYKLVKDKSIVFMNTVGKEYTESSVFRKDFYTAVAVSLVNEATGNDKVLLAENNNSLLNLDFDTIYKKLGNKNIGSLMKGTAKDVTQLSEIWNKACSVQYINEATASEMKDKFEEVYKNLGIADEEYQEYLKTPNPDAVLKELHNKNFTDSENLITAFENALKNNKKDDTSDDEAAKNDANKASSNKGGGNSGGGGISYTYNINPPVQYEPDEEKPEIIDNEFKDIDDVPWAKEAIYYLRDIEVINGKAPGEFKPNDYVTREEFVKMAVTAIDLNKTEGEILFDDVEKDAWYYEYILAGFNNNIIKGKSDMHFGTGEKITREDIAVIMVNAAKAANIDITATDTYGNVMNFEDIADISDYASDSVTKLYKCGIVNGVGYNKFAPKEPATRAQAAVFIYRLLMMNG